MEASRLHTTAATTTAVGPFGQAVANQNGGGDPRLPARSGSRSEPPAPGPTKADRRCSAQATPHPGRRLPCTPEAGHAQARGRAHPLRVPAQILSGRLQWGTRSYGRSRCRAMCFFPRAAANRHDGSRLLLPWRKAPPRPGSTCAAAGREHAPRRSRNTSNAAWPGRRDKPWRARSARRRHARGRHRGRAGPLRSCRRGESERARAR